MPKTITSLGIEKIGRRFADSVDHAAYTLNGAPKTVAPFRKIDIVNIGLHFFLKNVRPYAASCSEA